MHLFDILSFPLHATPPCLGEGLLQSLIFFFHPSPHVLLHLPKGPQDPHRPFTKLIKFENVWLKLFLNCCDYITHFIYHQCDGQQICLPRHLFSVHGMSSVRFPEHSPPLDSSTSLVLVLVLVPDPHLTEHALMAHSPHSQCTAINDMCDKGFW